MSAREARLSMGPVDSRVDDHLIPITRAFIGDPRSLLFEYDPDSRAIICDGQWGEMQDYTKHSPMTNWEIVIMHSEDKLQKLDFSTFDKIIMEFDCEVIWTGIGRS
jgi:hypothetical protein